MDLNDGKKCKAGIEIQCAACGFVEDAYEFYGSAVHTRFRICPKCGTVRYLCSDNKDFRLHDDLNNNKTAGIRMPKYHVGQKFCIDYPKQEEKCILKIYGTFEIKNEIICDEEVYYVMSDGSSVINVREDVLDICRRC